MIVRAPARHGRLVEPDGLAALRLALAISRDALPGDVESHLAFRSMPRPRNSGTAGSGVPVATGTVALSTATTAAPVTPSIPAPIPPSEPTGELATVMEIVGRAQ